MQGRTFPGDPSGSQVRVHVLHMPYSGLETPLYYRPRIYPRTHATADTSNGEIRLYVNGGAQTPVAIKADFDKSIAIIEDALQRLTTDVATFNKELSGQVRPRLGPRIQFAKQTDATTEAIDYPLRRRDDAPQTFKLPERPKAISPVSAPTITGQKQYSLSEADYQEILRTCTSMSLVMERSPTVFESAEEEHIRVHYLVQLNGQYNGAATGETFNNVGKTDILIRHENKNVFVAECKFWGGYKGLIETADQLLGYTTWRDTKTALMIFSRNQDFTNVVSEAQRAMKDHQQYKSGPRVESETRFRYVFAHPNDKQRDVIVTLMLFDMPKPIKPK